MIEKIVLYTNIYINNKQKDKYKRKRDAKETNRDEIEALIGLLYLAGYLRSSHQNLLDLYSKDGTGIGIFKATMSQKRFSFLLKCIRFDNIQDRDERKVIDKLAPIREFYEAFVNNCMKHYTLGPCVTIDEMLEDFRGRCSFRQYIKSKPAKYGLKVFALVDSESFYVYNLEIYAGQQPDGPFNISNASSDVVLRLIKPISKSGRNITMDNWFSSIPLAKKLLKEHNLTSVATLRKSKMEIPPIFISKGTDVHSSQFGFCENITLVSYTPKRDKCVLLLSTMHHDDTIIPENNNKPEIICYYNSTKAGVDVVDEMKGTYSVARMCNRWSLRLFFSVLNMAGINAQIIIKTNDTKNTSVRRYFLKELAFNLVQKHIHIC